MDKNTFLLRDTEAFMRGELDNVTVSQGRVVLDLIQGAYVPYGCYTSPALPMPLFDALRVSWNAATPPGTAVEAQARVLVDGNWTPWVSFGKWTPYLPRESAPAEVRGPLIHQPDVLQLDSKLATQAQLRIYLYTKEEKATPAVQLLGASVRAVNVIPAGGRVVHADLHMMSYAVNRRAPSLKPWMDLACCLAGLTNRWGADLLPEEFAQAMRDHRTADGEADGSTCNLCFAAAAAGCWGFPAWVCWADLALLRQEARQGYGAIVALRSTPAELARGLPEKRYALLRGFAGSGPIAAALLCDPWAADTDFETEISMPLDVFLVAWDNTALLMRRRAGAPPAGWPGRSGIRLMADKGADENRHGLYLLYKNGAPCPLPDDYTATGGILAWTTPDEKPHATTAHRTFHFTEPESGGIRLPITEGNPRKYTVYAIAPSGQMLVGDVTG